MEKLPNLRPCLDLEPRGQSEGTNNNANCILEEDRYQFVDDLTFLKIVNLVNIGISSHNTKQQGLNDIPTHGHIVEYLVQKSGIDCSNQKKT